MFGSLKVCVYICIVKQIKLLVMDLNELKLRAYNCACNRGLVDDKLSNSHYLCLITCDLMDAVKADMEDKYFDEQNEIDNYVRACLTNKEQAYEEYIDDTVEDKLSDAAIGILVLAWLKNVDMDDRFTIAYVVNKSKSFTENCYDIVRDIACYKYSLDELLNYSIRQIFRFAGFYDIDLLWHVDQKLRYNELTFKK